MINLASLREKFEADVIDDPDFWSAPAYNEPGGPSRKEIVIDMLQMAEEVSEVSGENIIEFILFQRTAEGEDIDQIFDEFKSDLANPAP